MAKETDAAKARETIIKLFNQKNLSNERLDLLNEMIKSMIEPPIVKESDEVKKLKKEISLYKQAGGIVLKDYVNSQLQKEKESKKGL
jgi:bacterioferritin (cytochrome b1)